MKNILFILTVVVINTAGFTQQANQYDSLFQTPQ
jgi:hypothetical protein